MPPLPTKRSALPLETKMKIIEIVDKRQLPKSKVAKMFKIPKSTLFTLIKNRDAIVKANESGVLSTRIRTREAKYPLLEKALLEWLKNMRAKNIPIDGNALKEKAHTFAGKLNVDDTFKGSEGWLQNFKLRHGLTFKKICGESSSVNLETVLKWKEETLKKLTEEHNPDDIFNADETGLFYKLLPDRSLVFKDETCTGGKRSKERITVLLAANMSGTEKLPLLVVGKSQKPRCFKGVQSLPVVYKANKKAWMTSEIFKEWVRNLDKKMAAQKRNILLIIDNCTAHPPEIMDLKAVKIEFMPPNVTSVLQPLDQGVIQSFKKNYRKKLINQILIGLQIGKPLDVTLLTAIHTASAAWQAVSEKTIVNCFHHAGFEKKYISCEGQNPLLTLTHPKRMKKVNFQLENSRITCKEKL